MNPGRGATRLGGDDMAVWVDVPAWLSPKLRSAFRAAGLEVRVHERFLRGELLGYDHDRFEFAGLAGPDVHGPARERAARRVQQIVDAVPESRSPGC